LLQMRKSIFIIIIFINATFPLSADDGGWSQSFSINSGSIYTETENPEIALEKEILIFDGNKTKAVFSFYNNSNNDLEVTCGFPVSYNINSYIEDDLLLIPIGKYNPGYIPYISYFQTLEYENPFPDEPSFVYPQVILITEENNKRFYISANTVTDLDFAISQEQNIVEIDTVLVELKADADGAEIIFHYKHTLHFPANTRSTVAVNYSQNLHYGSNGAGMGEMYRWNYIIGTGGTWKGPIQKLLIAVPYNWYNNFTQYTEKEELDLLFENKAFKLYLANNYNPEISDIYELGITRHSEYDLYMLQEQLPDQLISWYIEENILENPISPYQDFVINPQSSSELPDSVSVFTPDGVLLNAGFTANASFDGIYETAWSENATNEGIGEYLEIELTKNIWGLEIQNGFLRLKFDDYIYESNVFRKEIQNNSRGYKDYFTLNNRLQTLLIKSISGETLYTLNLEDRRNIQSFGGVVLEPGTYRFEIADVYKGTVWNDTCIGEITFLETQNSLPLNSITGDPFFMSHLQNTVFIAGK